MATYSAPTTITTGQLVTASLMNTDWGGNITFLANPPHCAVRHSVAQSHATSGAWQAVVFDTEDEDTNTMHSTVSNTSRITATTAGLYVVTALIIFASNATGLRAANLRKNGTGASGPNLKGRAQVVGSATDSAYLGFSTVVKLAAADYIEVIGFQSSGGALNITASTTEQNPFFTATWIGLG